MGKEGVITVRDLIKWGKRNITTKEVLLCYLSRNNLNYDSLFESYVKKSLKIILFNRFKYFKKNSILNKKYLKGFSYRRLLFTS